MVTAENLISKARKYIGIPYKYGGNSPSNGFDCSGFVQYIFKECGIDVGRTTYDQIKKGTKIKNKDDLMPGDLIFFIDNNNSPYHVVIYTGDNKIIESPRTGLSVRELDLYRWNEEARRILDTPNTSSPTTPVEPKTYFRVICGSFASRELANQRIIEIKNIGFDSFLFAYKNNDKPYFRVVCGSFASRELANQRKNDLKTKGFDSFLLAYEE